MSYFTTEVYGGITIVRFSFNEIGFQGREDLKSELYALIAEDSKTFIFNLSKIGFLSTLAVSILIFFSKEVKTQGGVLRLCSLTEEAQEVLKITHLDSVFDIYETEESAMKDLA